MVYRIFVPAVPIFEVMGAISILALAANGTCLALLWKHRQEDVNMSSAWECSRNDITSNYCGVCRRCEGLAHAFRMARPAGRTRACHSVSTVGRIRCVEPSPSCAVPPSNRASQKRSRLRLIASI